MTSCRACYWRSTSPNHKYDAYHIATGVAVSFGDVVRIIKARIPKADISYGSGPLQFVDGTEAVRKGALSIARAQKELGLQAQVDDGDGPQRLDRSAADRQGLEHFRH
jgi:nucleoside-diphosphate-sugar epimerase